MFWWIQARRLEKVFQLGYCPCYQIGLAAPVLKIAFQKQISFTIISTLSKNEQKINVRSLKKLKISVHGTWNPAILRLQGASNYGR